MLDLYGNLLKDHYMYPRHTTPLQAPSASATIINSSCGDSSTCQIIIAHDQVAEISIQSKGCVISVATGSLFAEWIQKKPINFSEEHITAFLKQHTLDTLGPVRMRCALLAIEAFQEALTQSHTHPTGL